MSLETTIERRENIPRASVAPDKMSTTICSSRKKAGIRKEEYSDQRVLNQFKPKTYQNKTHPQLILLKF